MHCSPKLPTFLRHYTRNVVYSLSVYNEIGNLELRVKKVGYNYWYNKNRYVWWAGSIVNSKTKKLREATACFFYCYTVHVVESLNYYTN